MTTPHDIEAARARVVAAGIALRERPRAVTVDALARLLDAWSDPGSPWQKRLVDALPDAAGFSTENVRDGLAAGLRDWTGEALRALVDRELGRLGGGVVASGFESTSVVLAGSIPMPSILSLLAPLALHSPVLAKTASRDPVTAPLFRESLLATDPELGAALEVVSFDGEDDMCREVFLDAPCVVATGSDETVARIAADARRAARCVTYGHRVSLAVIGDDALTPETAKRIARDTALWDQLGCLSPVAVLAVGAGPEAGERFARWLAEALATAEERAPRGPVPPAAAAAFRAERDGAEMRRAGGADVSVHADEALRWTVVREADAGLRPAPLHRFLRVHPVAERADLRTVLAPLAPHLAGVALAGFGERRDDVARELAGLGASRLCAPGELQTPPLGWHHDNLEILLPLARLADLESAQGR